jgi:hypothetical protein
MYLLAIKQRGKPQRGGPQKAQKEHENPFVLFVPLVAL